MRNGPVIITIIVMLYVFNSVYASSIWIEDDDVYQGLWKEKITITENGDAKVEVEDWHLSVSWIILERASRFNVEFYLGEPVYSKIPEELEIDVIKDGERLIQGEDFWFTQTDPNSPRYKLEIKLPENTSSWIEYEIHMNYTLKDFVRRKSRWSGLHYFYINKWCSEYGQKTNCLSDTSNAAITEIKILNQKAALLSFPEDAFITEDRNGNPQIKIEGMKYIVVEYEDTEKSSLITPSLITFFGAIIGAFLGAVIGIFLNKGSDNRKPSEGSRNKVETIPLILKVTVSGLALILMLFNINASKHVNTVDVMLLLILIVPWILPYFKSIPTPLGPIIPREISEIETKEELKEILNEKLKQLSPIEMKEKDQEFNVLEIDPILQAKIEVLTELLESL